MTVRLPRASARACKASGRSAYRMVIMSVPVRTPPAPASLPQMNTEGDDVITDDHIMRGETGAGAAAGPGGPPPRQASLAGPRHGRPQGGAAARKAARLRSRLSRPPHGRREGDHADRPGEYPRWPAHGRAGHGHTGHGRTSHGRTSHG